MKDINALMEKYNKPVPRYTSYPPVPYWSGRPAEEEWIAQLKRNYDSSTGIDLYVHVPFCESLCFYCGCNRTITKNHGVEKPFVDMLLKEWSLYKEKWGISPVVNSIHFGGGTPTFLSPAKLDKLMSELLANRSSQFIGSIEIDPRTITNEHFDVLEKWNITRVSLGIQDFDETVQKAINRKQSPEMVFDVVKEIRKRKFDSLNFDLIYGLPKQTVESIERTFNIVNRMSPDSIAFYSYAHLPDKIKNQKLINEADLPEAAKKRELFNTGKRLLEEVGMVEIGLDHFAKPGSFLEVAMKEKKLQRNFMGYVDRKSKILLGLGPTSISDSSESFVQNEKNTKDYEMVLRQNLLPHSSGHIHSEEDLVVQKILQELMCEHTLDLSDKNNIPHWGEIETELGLFEEDALLSKSCDKIVILPLGKAFLRNIAVSFDFHHRKQTYKRLFSQSV